MNILIHIYEELFITDINSVKKEKRGGKVEITTKVVNKRNKTTGVISRSSIMDAMGTILGGLKAPRMIFRRNKNKDEKHRCHLRGKKKKP